MNDKPKIFGSPKNSPAYSPRPVTITIPPGQEVRIIPGPELAIKFADGTTVPARGGPGDSSRSPQEG